MKLLTLLIGLLGLGFTGYLIFNEGPQLVFGALAAAGWGTIVVCLLHIPHMALAGRGWQVLWPKNRRPSLLLFMWVLWIREAVNALLPVARIGGEVVAAQLLKKSGMPMASNIGSLVVETTLSVITTFLFVIMGLFVFSWRIGSSGIFLQWAVGLSVAVLLLGAFVMLQRMGGFTLFAKFINWVAKDKFSNLTLSSAKLDRAVRAFYGRPVRVFGCSFWSFLGWFVGAFEIWVALLFLGHDASFSDGIVLEAMILAMGSAAFFVPASIGVQEGTILFFGKMLGIPDDICLALGLMRRARDVLVMAPGLIIWQLREGKGWLARFIVKKAEKNAA